MVGERIGRNESFQHLCRAGIGIFLNALVPYATTKHQFAAEAII
jgi:hypothetical protein